jgi:hypothetical protein
VSTLVDVYVASFTEEGNALSQWRAYGAQGGGYSVGIRDLPFPPSPVPVGEATVALALERVPERKAHRARA